MARIKAHINTYELEAVFPLHKVTALKFWARDRFPSILPPPLNPGTAILAYADQCIPSE